jgi:hypothetical protein
MAYEKCLGNPLQQVPRQKRLVDAMRSKLLLLKGICRVQVFRAEVFLLVANEILNIIYEIS